MPCNVARVHDPSCLRVHSFETIAPMVVSKIQGKTRARLGSILFCRGTRWYAGLQNGKTGIGGRPPKKTLCEESMPLFAVVVERLNPSDAHKTDSVHKLEPSGSRTPLSISRSTSGKSLFTSSRTACLVLVALESPLSTGLFCCGVYGAVSSRRIPRPLQYSTNVELVYSAPLSVLNARGTPT